MYYSAICAKPWVQREEANMATKFFGQFLLEQGAISREVLLEAVKFQKSINLPLCALAVEKGFLSKAQLAELDNEGKDTDKQFMELAVKNSMLSFTQLEELSKAQAERWMFLGEALVRKGQLNLVQLDQLFEEYRNEHPAPEPDVLPPMKDVPNGEIISSFLETTVEIFVHYTKQIVQVLSVEMVSDEPEAVAYIFSQKVLGDKTFSYALALPEELALSIASHMLQEEATEIDAMVLDAVSEFVNIVVGNGCIKLNMNNFKIKAEPPQIMIREMIEQLMPRQSVTARLKTAKGEFLIVFCFDQISDG